MARLNIVPFAVSHADSARDVFRSRLGDYFAPGEESEFEATLESLIHPEDSEEHIEFWGGWAGDRMVAFGGVEAIDGCGYLCWGTVHSEFAGRGFGRQLLEHRLSRLREIGVGSAFSDTGPRTEGFFARFGFEPFFRQPRYWGGEIDLVAMELSFDGVRRGPLRIRPDGTLGYRPALATPDDN